MPGARLTSHCHTGDEPGQIRKSQEGGLALGSREKFSVRDVHAISLRYPRYKEDFAK